MDLIGGVPREAGLQTNQSISRVFIANRGEIALRILRACERLSIGAVCAVSEADKNSLVARTATEVAFLGEAPARDSYLNAEKIVAAAVKHGCDALHPGYGFLSENAQFAKAVIDAGITFIGPDPEMIELLGDKVAARERVAHYGVPFTRGSVGGLSDAELVVAADEIGYPVMVKAAAGGGGRGMRVVRSRNQMIEELPRARAEARKFFGSEEVYFEQFIEHPRHVEVQIMGDRFGTILHFGTRDCSSQRRNQKVIEEAPAPFLADDFRERIHVAAVNVARSVGYHNAGTVEFMVKEEAFYFLEMNTRIQVEHPATEMVTGYDLVEMQIRVARGETLPISQSDIQVTGHAIELRLYAEDPASDFMPSMGTISQLSLPEPHTRYCRIEQGFERGDTVSRHYDAMLAKIIVWGADREEALNRAREAVSQTTVAGVRTNRDFLGWLLRDTPLRLHPLDIQWIGEHLTPEQLARYERTLCRDPAHTVIGPVGEYQERCAAPHPRGGCVEIVITHRRDGTFVAEPVLRDANDGHIARAPRAMWRWSNDRAAAIASLCEEVIHLLPR
jgi:acetyl/propionyl-CoA carboxylase alpha subunit